ncbi:MULTISPECIES: hypothetical protein [unclassified Streptomyces]|uniref:hypothetical protein n=1 Tax=unclassified Streptomyces TaxID=2593676 RepID=UPI000805513D|nr:MULTISPECIES: hypothetical protein [unclassified Streptomyces]MYR75112.1 hypothetical protein [Streptomyces sp. SID4925]SBU97958.1 hypothetical protein YUMDRAFT_05982 [Streptomyces sp. OspMP-M45]
MPGRPTAYIVMIGASPTAVATDLAAAQEMALAREKRLYINDDRLFRWSERPGEWRLMARRPEKGARWCWTRRSVRSAPLFTS